MKRRATLPVLLFSSIAFLACSPAAPPPPTVDLAAEEAAIRAQDAKWMDAVQKRDAAAEAALIADDAVIYREHGDPLAGPAAFQAFEQKFYTDNPMSTASWTTAKIEIAASGDLAVQTGTYNDMKLGPKGAGEDHGSFVTEWRKVNGTWMVVHDIGSSTMPETPATKPGG